MASRAPTTIDFEKARLAGGRGCIEPFVVGRAGDGSAFGPDLAYLVELLARKALDPQIGWRGPWERAAEAAGALLARRVRGKAVLDVGSWPGGRC